MKMIYALLLLPTIALASGAPEPPKAQSQGQAQGQMQGQETTVSVDANSGASTDAISDSNSFSESGSSSELSYRGGTSLGQGAVFIPTCGAGGNAGGSDGTKAAFLGFAYITAKCYDLTYAAAYAALGQRQAACDILRMGRYGKGARKRGIPLPEVCAEPKPEQIIVPVATVDEKTVSREHVEKIVEQCCQVKDGGK